MLTRIATAVLFLAIMSPLVAGPPHPVATPLPGVRGVVLVSVDGLRPDLVLRAEAPTLRALMARGCFSLWALTTPLAVTLPSHASMLTGVPPATHGIVWNGDRPAGARLHPARPTLFELARWAGYRTAMAAGKSKFVALAVPGTLDRSYVPATSVTTDSTVTDTAVRWIAESAPQVLFVHLPQVDTAGHASGWGSNDQLAAIATADRCIGRLLEALERRHLLDSTVFLVTADHGGAGRSHGPGDPRSLHIPWIIAGPGIRHGVDLTLDAGLVIHTEDSFATLCFVLGIPVTERITGRVVEAAFAEPRQPTHAPGVGRSP
jgi:predicted AlkP superfamily pyrophosphatase or phosphodiesterase